MNSIITNPITWLIIAILVMVIFPNERSARLPAILTLVLAVLMLGFTSINWMALHTQQIEQFFVSHRVLCNPLIWWVILLFNHPAIGIGRIPPIKKFWKESPRGDAPGHLVAKTILTVSFPIMIISGILSITTPWIWLATLSR